MNMIIVVNQLIQDYQYYFHHNYIHNHCRQKFISFLNLLINILIILNIIFIYFNYRYNKIGDEGA